MVSQYLLVLMKIRGGEAVEGCALDGDDGNARGIIGGRNFGDSVQFPPVGKPPLWAERPNAPGYTIEGRAVWLCMNTLYQLSEIMREQGDTQAFFRATLSSTYFFSRQG